MDHTEVGAERRCPCGCCGTYRLSLDVDGNGDFRAACVCALLEPPQRCPCPACLLAVRIAVLEAIG